MRFVLLIILLLLVLGALPTWPYSGEWGYYPSGGLGLVLVIVLIWSWWAGSSSAGLGLFGFGSCGLLHFISETVGSLDRIHDHSVGALHFALEAPRPALAKLSLLGASAVFSNCDLGFFLPPASN